MNAPRSTPGAPLGLTLALALLAGLALLAASPPSTAPATAPASAAPPSTPAATLLGPLPVEADWQARASAWFGEAKEEPARRTAMREITKALKEPCRYCHTPDWKGYTDKLAISRQMMALSAEHGVPCADCHEGKDALSALGQTAQTMWKIAHEQKVDCGHCHVPGKRFKALTAAGEAFEAKR